MIDPRPSEPSALSAANPPHALYISVKIPGAVARKLSKDEAVDLAVHDAARRAGVDPAQARVASVTETEFPNTALGAPRPGEMSADMMTPGWVVRVDAGSLSLEYHAAPRQVRLAGFDGGNHVVFPD